MQVFKLFKTNRTHMMLACALDSTAQVPGNILSVRSQQNILAKGAKHMTGEPLCAAPVLSFSDWDQNGMPNEPRRHALAL